MAQCSKLRKILKRLVDRNGYSGDVFRNMLVLAVGSSAAKAVGTLFIPVVTRLYTPEQYGLLTLFVSATALLTPFTSLRYSAALPLPRFRSAASSLLLTCLMLLSISIGLMAVILFFFSKAIFDFISISELAPYWALLVLSVGAAGLYEILQNWAIRTKAFALMAKAELAMSLVGGALKVSFALMGYQRIGLMVGHVFSQGLSCVMLGAKIRVPLKKIRIKYIRYSLARNSDFPIYRLPSQLLLNYSVQAPIFFFASVYGPAVAGQLGLALVAMAVPITLVGQSTGQAFYGEISRIGKGDPKRISEISVSVAKRMVIIGVVPTLVLMIGGRQIFPIFFGANWVDAGMYASILSIYLLMQFISNPLGHVLSVLNRQVLFLQFNVVRAVLVTCVLLSAFYFDMTPVTTLVMYSVSLAVNYLFMTYSVFGVLRQKVREIAALEVRQF